MEACLFVAQKRILQEPPLICRKQLMNMLQVEVYLHLQIRLLLDNVGQKAIALEQVLEAACMMILTWLRRRMCHLI